MIETIIGGLAAGSIHVLAGPDHLAAVAPMAAERDTKPWRAGLLWGFGHAAGVIVVGAAALLLRDLIPIARVSGVGERVVGGVLIGIGVWAIIQAVRQRVHVHEHAHDGLTHAHVHAHERHASHDAPHSHSAEVAHVHVRSGVAFGVGILHGLAGTAHFLGILPALAFPNAAEAIAYVGAFSVGTVVAMSGFAALIGWVARRFAKWGQLVYRSLLIGFGLVAIVVGVAWLIRLV